MKSEPVGSVANAKSENEHSGFEKPFKKFDHGKYNQMILEQYPGMENGALEMALFLMDKTIF